MSTHQSFLAKLYLIAGNRAPDMAAYRGWSDELDSGMAEADVANAVFATAESRRIYPDSLSTEQFIDAVYINVLGRLPDPDGLAFWIGLLNQPDATRASIAMQIADAALGNPVSELFIKNRFEFTQQLLSRQISHDDQLSTTLLENMMHNINGSRDSLLDAIATVDAHNAPPPDNSAAHATNGEYVIGLYLAALNRAPDIAGFNYWVAQLDSGVASQAVAESIINSIEATQRLPTTMSNLDLALQVYQDMTALATFSFPHTLLELIANAAPDRVTLVQQIYAAALQEPSNDVAGTRVKFSRYVVDQQTMHDDHLDLNQLGNVSRAVGSGSTLDEAKDLISRTGNQELTHYVSIDVDQLTQLYIGILNRAPDYDGLQYWTNVLNHGSSLENIALRILESDEGQVAYAPSQTDDQFIQAIYQNVLNAAPSAAALRAWHGQLEAGVSRAEVMVDFLHTAVNAARSEGFAVLLGNRLHFGALAIDAQREAKVTLTASDLVLSTSQVNDSDFAFDAATDTLLARIQVAQAATAAPTPSQTPATEAPEQAAHPVSTAQLGAPDNAKLIVDCYGDSTTYGYDQGAQVASPMPGSLQTALATASGKPVVVNNLGVNSTTAEDLLHGNAATGQAEFADRIAHSNAAVVVFNFGLNETLRGQSPESFHDALTELVLLAQNAGKKVIISTPNPVDLTLQPWATDLPKMHDVAVSVADETGAALDDEFATLSAQSDWQAELTDGVHPGPALYETKGESLATVVLEITGLTPTHQLI